MACPFVYAYEAWGHTYVGCMQKVYEVEIDLELLEQAETGRSGFGAVRARRAPLPMCEVEVVGTYPHREDELGCRIPEFHELPREARDVPRVRDRRRLACSRKTGSPLARNSGRAKIPKAAASRPV
jgi:hypothetical protein